MGFIKKTKIPCKLNKIYENQNKLSNPVELMKSYVDELKELKKFHIALQNEASLLERMDKANMADSN